MHHHLLAVQHIDHGSRRPLPQLHHAIRAPHDHHFGLSTGPSTVSSPLNQKRTNPDTKRRRKQKADGDGGIRHNSPRGARPGPVCVPRQWPRRGSPTGTASGSSSTPAPVPSAARRRPALGRVRPQARRARCRLRAGARVDWPVVERRRTRRTCCRVYDNRCALPSTAKTRPLYRCMLIMRANRGRTAAVSCTPPCNLALPSLPSPPFPLRRARTHSCHVPPRLRRACV